MIEQSEMCVKDVKNSSADKENTDKNMCINGTDVGNAADKINGTDISNSTDKGIDTDISKDTNKNNGTNKGIGTHKSNGAAKGKDGAGKDLLERIGSLKGWLYLLPAVLFLGAFMVYPLIDVFVYSFEEGYNSASQTYLGTGGYNYSYVLHDPYFLQAVKNTFILVIITVPLSTGIALLISVGLNSIKPLRNLFQTIYFLPYVTNTLAVGLVFMILFKKTPYTDGLINLLINWFGGSSVDFIDGPYWAKMFVLCFYTIWVVMPFKILILTSALASVNQDYYNAAKVDGTSKLRTFGRITLPMISPMIFYLVITGFIGAFKAYSDVVALFGTDLNAAKMNTIVGYIYDMLYGDSGGYPSYASAAAIILFAIILTITCINLLVSKRKVHY